MTSSTERMVVRFPRLPARGACEFAFNPHTETAPIASSNSPLATAIRMGHQIGSGWAVIGKGDSHVIVSAQSRLFMAVLTTFLFSVAFGYGQITPIVIQKDSSGH